jgi:threonine/homoserine/homoserine lactone efflux protein
MTTLLLQTVPLALGGMVSPIVLLIQIGNLSGARPVARGIAFSIGAAIPLVIIAAIGLGVGHPLQLSRHPNGRAGVRIVIGLVLIALAIRTTRRRDQAQQPRDVGKRSTLGGALALGVFCMATNETTLALWIALISDIISATVTEVERVAAATIDLAIVLGVVVIPLIATVLSPVSAARLLAIAHTWIDRYRRPALALVCAAIGTVLLISGVILAI